MSGDRGLLAQLVRFLGGRGFHAFEGRMPAAPERAVALYAEDLRPPGDEYGSGVLIHVRGEKDGDSAMLDALGICRALCGFEGRLCPGGRWIARVEPELGVASAGFDQAQRPFYAMTLRVYEV